MQPGHLIKEGERSITGPVGEAIDQTGKNIGDTMEKAGRDVKEQAGRTCMTKIRTRASRRTLER